MFEKLAVMEQKFKEINEKLSNPDIVNDNKLYTQLMREYKNMTPIIEKYREYKTVQKARISAEFFMFSYNIASFRKNSKNTG